MIRTFNTVMMVMMTLMMITAVLLIVLLEADASDVKDLDAHVDDGGVLILFLSRSVQCTVRMGTS